MINVLIVEDEYTIALDIEERLKQMKFSVAGIAAGYDKALPILFNKNPDIVLLDINLGDGKSGIDLAELIHKKFDIPVIFLSAYSDDATFKKAQAANPMGFIIKPFKDEDLDHGIKLALQRYKEIKQNDNISRQTNIEINTTDNFVFIKDKGQILRINKKEILWLEAMDNYTIVHILKEKHIVNSFLKDVLAKLNSRNFFRIHKSHAVALDKITKIEDNLIFIDKIYLIISRKYKKELMDRLNLL
ncbi:MAG: response regulator [Bacteroidales bacterium]|nr:response regulator [Bacteroidales bacterium]